MHNAIKEQAQAVVAEAGRVHALCGRNDAVKAVDAATKGPQALGRTVSVYGCIAAAAGAEHGVGELWQGAGRPEGLVFASWAGSPFFAILAGEPAMSLIPSFRLSGAATIALSLALAAWAIRASGRYRGLGMLALALPLLLVGGGFGPPLVAGIAGLFAALARPAGANQASASQRRSGPSALLGATWPWIFGVSLATWLLLMPGTLLLDRYFTLKEPEALVMGASGAAFLGLFLSLGSALARDRG